MRRILRWRKWSRLHFFIKMLCSFNGLVNFFLYLWKNEQPLLPHHVWQLFPLTQARAPLTSRLLFYFMALPVCPGYVFGRASL